MKKICLALILLFVFSSVAFSEVEKSDNFFMYTNKTGTITTLVYAAYFHNVGEQTIDDTGSDLVIYDENGNAILKSKSDVISGPFAQISRWNIAPNEYSTLLFKYVFPTSMLEGRTPTTVEYYGMKSEFPVSSPRAVLTNGVKCNFNSASNKGYSAKVKVTNDTLAAVDGLCILLNIMDERGETIYVASDTVFEELGSGKTKTFEVFLDKDDINALKKSDRKPKSITGVVYEY